MTSSSIRSPALTRVPRSGGRTAALLTVRIPSRTKWTEIAGFRNATTVGPGPGPGEGRAACHLCTGRRGEGLTAEDAEHLKAFLEAEFEKLARDAASGNQSFVQLLLGHYPEKKEWPRPEPGQSCCLVVRFTIGCRVLRPSEL